MKSKLNRRDFFARTSKAGLAGCALFMGLKLSGAEHLATLFQDENIIPDPAKLNYCGYTCPEKCPWLQGSNENNLELKKEGYEKWKIKERLNKNFDPKTMFCYGCKAEGKPDGFILKQCTVRSCCKEKGLECCIECDELTDCDKDLWKRFPKFKEAVIGMQKKYQASKS